MSETAELFAGIGILSLCLVITYFMYQIARLYQQIADKEEAMFLLEEAAINQYATNKGFDIAKLKIKKQLFKNTKNLRKKIEAEIYDNLFPTEEKKGV